MEIVCIVCPNSCSLDVELSGDKLTVKGNKCPRGVSYAENEIKNPKRSVTATVATVFMDVPVVPVKTNDDIPKELIFPLMQILRETRLDKRVPKGYPIIKNVLGTGADIIITSNIMNF